MPQSNKKKLITLFKTYGCSFTEYQWPTWTYWLATKASIERHGIPGAGNEDIARNIVTNADNDSIQVVMWSGFDRISRDKKKFNNLGEGKYQGDQYSLYRLMARTYEQIYMANTFCSQNKIKIFNFLAFPLELGEDTKLQNITHPMRKLMPEMPISFSEWCLENQPIITNKKDQHPTVSQHFYYYNNIMCKKIGSAIADEDLEDLRKQDLKYATLKTKSQWANYKGPINYEFK